MSAKRILRLLMPGLYDHLAAKHYQRQMDQFFVERTRLSRRLMAKHGDRVLHGPFKGMPVMEEADGGISTSQMLGSYEAELHPVLFELASEAYTNVVDIGCASGYYSTGFALLFPTATVWAFDAEAECVKKSLLRARVSGVENRMCFGGFCSQDRLNTLCRERTLVLCDIEGCEKDLIDPASIPNLAQADLIVELHDAIDSTITPTLTERLAKTHQFQNIVMQPRIATGYPELEGLSATEIEMAFSENKQPTTWGIWRSNVHAKRRTSRPAMALVSV